MFFISKLIFYGRYIKLGLGIATLAIGSSQDGVISSDGRLKTHCHICMRTDNELNTVKSVICYYLIALIRNVARGIFL